MNEQINQIVQVMAIMMVMSMGMVKPVMLQSRESNILKQGLWNM